MKTMNERQAKKEGGGYDGPKRAKKIKKRMVDHHRQEQTRVTNLQHELLRERKHLLAGQRRRKPARRRPWVDRRVVVLGALRFDLQHVLQARPRSQRGGHQLFLQLRHGCRVQHRIARVRLQKVH